MTAPRVVLASTSAYRAQLLRRLLDDFTQAAPDVAETHVAGEAPAARARRLAETKSRALAEHFPDALLIGSDQVAASGAMILDKPGDVATARAQLAACSGCEVVFHTAVCVLDTRVQPVRAHGAIDVTTVRFRTLDDTEIARYVERERPLDCAGSFKSEGLGIALFQRIETVDPTALIGLPLIALARLLREAGLATP